MLGHRLSFERPNPWHREPSAPAKLGPAILASPRVAAIKVMGGRLAQWVERLLYTQDVGGSSPSPPTRPLRRRRFGRQASPDCVRRAPGAFAKRETKAVGGL